MIYNILDPTLLSGDRTWQWKIICQCFFFLALKHIIRKMSSTTFIIFGTTLLSCTRYILIGNAHIPSLMNTYIQTHRHTHIHTHTYMFFFFVFFFFCNYISDIWHKIDNVTRPVTSVHMHL